jgi:hypothetical protein
MHPPLTMGLLASAFDFESPPVAHGLDSIQAQIQEELLDLGWINGDK